MCAKLLNCGQNFENLVNIMKIWSKFLKSGMKERDRKGDGLVKLKYRNMNANGNLKCNK